MILTSCCVGGLKSSRPAGKIEDSGVAISTGRGLEWVLRYGSRSVLKDSEASS